MTNDPIHYDREPARTRASFTMPGDVTITGDWGTGDLQATRNLAHVLADRFGDVAELLEASEQTNNKLAGDARRTRDQLRDALNALNRVRAEREAVERRLADLQVVADRKERQIDAILQRVDKDTGELLMELAILRAEADGARTGAVAQMAQEAHLERGEAVAEATKLQNQVTHLQTRVADLQRGRAELAQANQKMYTDNADLREQWAIMSNELQAARAELQALTAAPVDEMEVEWATEHTVVYGDHVLAGPLIIPASSEGEAQARFEFYAGLNGDKPKKPFNSMPLYKTRVVRRVHTWGPWMPRPTPGDE